jgi:hypothetical protein
MTVPVKGTPFSDVIGFEGITHGILPNVVSNLGAIGYGLQVAEVTAKPQEAVPTVAPTQTFSLDF